MISITCMTISTPLPPEILNQIMNDVARSLFPLAKMTPATREDIAAYLEGLKAAEAGLPPPVISQNGKPETDETGRELVPVRSRKTPPLGEWEALGIKPPEERQN